MRGVVVVLVAVAAMGLACMGPSQQYGQQGQAWGQAGGVAGPFQGPDGVSYYTDASGRMTFIDAMGVVYLAHADGNIVYSRDPYGGWYAVSGQQMSPLGPMPADAGTWPMAAQIPVAQAQGYPQGGGGYAQGGGGYDPATTQMMWDMNQMTHETNMNIIDNMATPSVDYYDQDNQYLGSW